MSMREAQASFNDLQCCTKQGRQPVLRDNQMPHHPRRRHGKQVEIIVPTQPTGPGTWHDPNAVAVFVPDGACPPALCGIPMQMATLPSHGYCLAGLAGDGTQDPEWAMPAGQPDLTRKAGAIVVEPDGRIWVIEPTNHYWGTVASFPKGTLDDKTCPRLTALREVFEETGLVVQLGEHLADVQREDAVVRLYRARRVSGRPVDMGWECQSVRLVPPGQVAALMAAPKEGSMLAAALQMLLRSER
jgi:ADP-ribose pyrophosphatase YjhB (NUDIX family)